MIDFAGSEGVFKDDVFEFYVAFDGRFGAADWVVLNVLLVIKDLEYVGAEHLHLYNVGDEPELTSCLNSGEHNSIN